MKSRLTGSSSQNARRHKPLSDDITSVGPLRTKSNKRKAKQLADENDRYVDSRSSRKILKIGQDLLEEEKKENSTSAPNRAFTIESRFGSVGELDEDADEEAEVEWSDEEADEIEGEVFPKIKNT